METTHAVHRHTPKLAVVDARGLPVASVAYCRASSNESFPETRTSRETFDAAGRSVANWDARLGSGLTPVASTIRTHGLTGQPLLTTSVDAGWRLVLQDEARQVKQSWDGEGNTARFEYDSMSRPLGVEENNRCVERFYYGTATAETSARNQCGRLIRHVDTAGARVVADYNLSGAPITEMRRFLTEVDHPGWPATESQQSALLEQGEDKAYTSRWQYDATGSVLEQVDAAGHTRRYAYSVQGQLQSVWLKVSGKPEHLLVGGMAYNASGQVERELSGNGVISTSVYDSGDGRLRHLLACKGERNLQDLRYDYDPVGNILCLTDASQPVSWFANQRIVPISRYWYDSLYQLVRATGREVASAVNGPALPDLISPADPARLQNYTQSWCYDAGGNLIEQHHSNKPTHLMGIAQNSNRGLTRVEGQEPDFDAGFDSNGNLRFLAPGQPMRWTARNQLGEVVLVSRDDGRNDSERYLYDGAGMRVRKVRCALTSNMTRKSEVRYLPGLEIRIEGADSPGEILHVINVQSGRSSVRLLHWEQGQPDGIDEDQVRYSLDDHLGSSTLELDRLGNLISYESYYAYGGTAWWMGRSQVEAKYKCVRYSGKERDVTGLYYYGFRYYAPWLQRWVNPDPAGLVDGLNLYCMVGGSPVGRRDIVGLYSGEGDEHELSLEKSYFIIARGRDQFKKHHINAFDNALHLAVEIVTEAIIALDTDDGEDKAHRRMRKIYKWMDVPAENLVNDFKKSQELLGSYFEGDELGEQIVFIAPINPKHEIAFVRRGDKEKRIFITPDFFRTQMNAASMARVLIHEVSHLAVNSVDFYYHIDPFGGTSYFSDSYSVEKQNKKIKELVVAASRSLDEVSVDIRGGKISDDRLEFVFGIADRKVIGSGIVSGGAFREKMILANTDTAAVAAISIGRSALHNYLSSRSASNSFN
ncbi:RHS repeat protein [Pseudomonas sp. PDM28]|mgnify:CR=1 FL=1|uniref:RHS repeat-associated core domain-containing protein n=1 Tax=Pseudomonas sp. PDM28 TaxID=2854770 RepID=UPI001C48A2AB|nr:RHS repeat-associated core domain-containing protein [Pseudomonas sp. PDM28]MBV7551293.1 RHS repeat protein [Pseudomonas sp. PDM28]